MLSSTIMTMRGMLALSSLLLGLLVGGCVAPALLPDANFAASPATGMSPLVVTFDASASTAPPNSTITGYAWDFGDGTTGSGRTAVHTYQTDIERTYVVVLQVSDHLGQLATATAEISVLAPIDEENPVSVEFVWPFHYDAEGDDAANLNDEYFALQNTGIEAVDLSGWAVENERGVTFQIPSGVMLAPNGILTIHSGNGSDSAGILYWDASQPVWNDEYDLAILRDSEGTIIDYYSYNSC